ncbi:MAG TPA: hypothetical protein ENN03_01145 [bacterium]|nr:hypothetical protein [bacterium]
MRKLTIALTVLMVCILPLSMVHAQRTAGSLAVEGFGGIGYPMSPEFFTDFWQMGIGFGGGAQYNFTDMTGFKVSYTYLPFKLNSDEFLKLFEEMIPAGMEIEIKGGAVNNSIISANLVQYLTPPDASFGFYIVAGAGYYLFSMGDLEMKVTYQGQTETVTEEMEDDMDDKIGINGGVGLEFMIGTTMNLFFEGKYHYLFGEEEGFDDTGGMISFITAMAGIRINL